MIAALTAVGVLSGAALVLIYTLTATQIKDNRNKEAEQAVLKIFPNANIAAPKKQAKPGREGIIEVVDKDNKILGYAFTAKGNGYQGTIELIVGVNGDLTQLMGIEVVESQETPGLGAEIAGGHNIIFNSGRSPGFKDLVNVDPLFVNPEKNDFRLQAGSPAIDAGEHIPEVTTDIDGNPRPHGKGYDIGPYEYSSSR